MLSAARLQNSSSLPESESSRKYSWRGILVKSLKCFEKAWLPLLPRQLGLQENKKTERLWHTLQCFENRFGLSPRIRTIISPKYRQKSDFLIVHLDLFKVIRKDDQY